MNQPRQRAICVLGMHRSGTSAVARALNLLGAYIGLPEKLMPPEQDNNPEGFWEHLAIVDFHERLLHTLLRSWDNVAPLPDCWWDRPEIEPYREELIALLRKEFTTRRLWMWKDPRTSLFLPLWREALQQLEIEPYYVICLRHPLDVAASLHRRDGFSIERSLVLWQFYNLSSFYWTNDARRWVISYDRLLEDWEPCLTNLVNAFDLGWPSSVAEQRVALGQFLQLQLRHSQSDLAALAASGDAGELVARAYRIFLEGERTPAILQSADFIRQIDREYRDYCRYPRVFAHLADVDVQAYPECPAIEVFWLMSGEFSQDAASSTDVFVDGQEHSYECRLPLPRGGVLRLDPVNFPAVVTIRSIELSVVDPDSKARTLVCSWGAENNCCDIVAGPNITLLGDHPQGLLCISSSDDPQLLLYNVPDVDDRENRVTAMLRVVMSVKHVIAKPLVKTLIQWRDKQQQAAAANVQPALEMRDSRIHDLEQTLQEQTATIHDLEQTLQEQTATFEELRQTTAELKTLHEQHKQEVEILHEQQTTLSRQYQEESRLRTLMLHSLSWRLTAPLRTLCVWLRYLWRIFRWPRRHDMQLEPLQQVGIVAEEFCSTGNDPQFLLLSSRGRTPTDWVVLSYVAKSPERWLRPNLYIDTGEGFSEQQKVSLHRPIKTRLRVVENHSGVEDQNSTLPFEAKTTVQFLFCLPSQVYRLRLDPLSSPGRFLLTDLVVREVNVLQVVVSLLWRHLRPFASQPRLLVSVVRQTINTLKREGLKAVKRRFLLQEPRNATPYQEWVQIYDTLTSSDYNAIRRHIEQLPHHPLISVIMPTYNTPQEYLRKAIESVRRQLYNNWELCIADDASTSPRIRQLLEQYQAQDPRIRVTYRETNGHISAASNSALDLATGDFVAFLDHDDMLTEHALYMAVVELNTYPDADLIYSDEDKIDQSDRRYGPYFKPDWNPELCLAQNLVTHLCLCRRRCVQELGGLRLGYEGAQDWDLVLRLTERIPSSHIRHIPHILYHWRAIAGSTALGVDEKVYVRDAQFKMISNHFHRLGQAVEISSVSEVQCWRVKYPVPSPAPLVTLIIPTRNAYELLRRCVESIYAKTRYPKFTVLIVDNQSNDPMTLEYLRQLERDRGVAVLRYDTPFNYAAINNFAVRSLGTEVIGFLNNDLEVISPGWLDEMASHAMRPEIGAVGAMLYYPDETIQHAGVVVGLGGTAAHIYSRSPRGSSGQLGRARLVQNLSAVTAACLVVRRSVFNEVNGFDETNFAVAYNDIDLCLRIQERGYRNIWTPFAELYHWESASRGYEDTPEKQIRFRKEFANFQSRWSTVIAADPAYNVNLSLDSGDFSLAFPPRSTKPWKNVPGEMQIAANETTPKNSNVAR